MKMCVVTELRTQNYSVTDGGFVCIIYSLVIALPIHLWINPLPDIPFPCLAIHADKDFIVNEYFISSSNVGVASLCRGALMAAFLTISPPGFTWGWSLLL